MRSLTHAHAHTHTITPAAGLEKEDVCNEFYLQLVKQTTDQPDPNSKINVANWRFFVLTLCVVVPRHKPLLAYVWAHLLHLLTVTWL
jgi:hypothetical protein